MKEPFIRSFRGSDLDALARVYQDAVRHLGPSHYSTEQVCAWAGFANIEHTSFKDVAFTRFAMRALQ